MTASIGLVVERVENIYKRTGQHPRTLWVDQADYETVCTALLNANPPPIEYGPKDPRWPPPHLQPRYGMERISLVTPTGPVEIRSLPALLVSDSRQVLDQRLRDILGELYGHPYVRIDFSSWIEDGAVVYEARPSVVDFK